MCGAINETSATALPRPPPPTQLPPDLALLGITLDEQEHEPS